MDLPRPRVGHPDCAVFLRPARSTYQHHVLGSASALGDVRQAPEGEPLAHREQRHVDRDGQQSAGEPVVPGVTVNLYAADGTTLTWGQRISQWNAIAQGTAGGSTPAAEPTTPAPPTGATCHAVEW